jgi:hypothetical protein
MQLAGSKRVYLHEYQGNPVAQGSLDVVIMKEESGHKAGMVLEGQDINFLDIFLSLCIIQTTEEF